MQLKFLGKTRQRDTVYSVKGLLASVQIWPPSNPSFYPYRALL